MAAKADPSAVQHALKGHLDQILALFDRRISNAAEESFNSRTPASKSATRCFCNVENSHVRILFFCRTSEALANPSRLILPQKLGEDSENFLPGTSHGNGR